MPAGVLRARSVRNSDEVKPKLGNEDVDFAVLRPKASNPIIQHPNKLQSHKSQRLGPRAISGKLELGALDLGFSRGFTVLPGVWLRTRAAHDRWFASLAPSARYNCPKA